MKFKTGWIIFAVALPLVVLMVLIFIKQHRLQQGIEVILPIRGYDPRDLLAGHYLTFRLDIPSNEQVCSYNDVAKTVYVCLLRGYPRWSGYLIKEVWQISEDQCDAILKGQCNRGDFTAGVEKFYVPEKQAQHLENLLLKHQATIKLKIKSDYTAVISDLLIDEK